MVHGHVEMGKRTCDNRWKGEIERGWKERGRTLRSGRSRDEKKEEKVRRRRTKKTRGPQGKKCVHHFIQAKKICSREFWCHATDMPRKRGPSWWRCSLMTTRCLTSGGIYDRWRTQEGEKRGMKRGELNKCCNPFKKCLILLNLICMLFLFFNMFTLFYCSLVQFKCIKCILKQSNLSTFLWSNWYSATV